MPQEQPNWTFERKISLPMLIILLTHTCGAFWYAAKLDARVGRLEEKTSNNIQIMERILRLEIQLDSVEETNTRIERSLDKLLENMSRERNG